MDASEALGIVEGLRNIFSEFSAGWFVGLSTICYLIIQILRGKAGFKIPFITSMNLSLDNSKLFSIDHL